MIVFMCIILAVLCFIFGIAGSKALKGEEKAIEELKQCKYELSVALEELEEAKCQ